MSSSSDSDDFGDYLTARRAKLAKQKEKKKVVSSDDSDSDVGEKKKEEEVVVVKKRVVKKREYSDEDDADSDEDFTPKTKKTHNDYIQEKLLEAEREYLRDVQEDVTEIVYEKTGRGKNARYQPKKMVTKDNLARCHQLFDEIDTKNDSRGNKSYRADEDEVQVVLNKSSIFPVTIEILDTHQTSNGIKQYEMKMHESFEEVITSIAKKWKCLNDEVLLKYNGEVVDMKSTPRGIGCEPMQMPYPQIQAQLQKKIIETVHFEEEPEEPTGLKIKIQLNGRRKPLFVQLENESTIREIKEKICEAAKELKEDLKMDEIRLMFDDEYLTNDALTCEDVGMEHEDCIDVY